jgi:predicted alpha/beta superfamily hydrolase
LNGVVRDVFLSYLENEKKIYDYEIRIEFKYNIDVGFTIVLFLDGNQVVGSFLSLYKVVVGNALLLEGKLMGGVFPLGTMKSMKSMI